MPYIPENRRNDIVNDMDRACLRDPGELNYAITRLFANYLADHELNYRTINDILGAADGASKEFYRKVAEPYEDFKRDVNGEVYPDIQAVVDDYRRKAQ